MRVYKTYLLLSVLVAGLCCACGCTSKNAAAKEDRLPSAVVHGDFSADSAYSYIADQVSFGPRVPGTAAHDRCAEYLQGRLREFGADTVMVQRGRVTAFNGDKLDIQNIFAKFNAESPERVLLVAHWDSRPWANMEASADRRTQPVPGANDGASGVGVLLEIARNLGMKAPNIGVDILLTDAEDYGNSGDFADTELTWCLGSQYWAKNMPYKMFELPKYGILLDMVGGENARFHREQFSDAHAKVASARVWGEAKALGYDDIFVNKPGGAVVDDHVFITAAGIPTVDVIEHMNDVTGTFPARWHTLDDNLDGISLPTLDAVGKTVLNVIYKER